MARFFSAASPGSGKVFTLLARTPSNRFSGFSTQYKSLKRAEDQKKLEDAAMDFGATGDFETYKRFLTDFSTQKLASTDASEQLWGSQVQKLLQNVTNNKLQLDFSTLLNDFDNGTVSTESVIVRGRDIISQMPPGDSAERMRGQLISFVDKQRKEANAATEKRLDIALSSGEDALKVAQEYQRLADNESDPSTRAGYEAKVRVAKVTYAQRLYSKLEDNFRDSNMSPQEFVNTARSIQQIAVENGGFDYANGIERATDELGLNMQSGDKFSFLGRSFGGSAKPIDIGDIKIQTPVGDKKLSDIVDHLKYNVPYENNLRVGLSSVVQGVIAALQSVPPGNKIKASNIPAEFVGNSDDPAAALQIAQQAQAKINEGLMYEDYTGGPTASIKDVSGSFTQINQNAATVLTPDNQQVDLGVAPQGVTSYRLVKYAAPNGQTIFLPEYRFENGQTTFNITPDLAQRMGMNLQTNQLLPVPSGYGPSGALNQYFSGKIQPTPQTKQQPGFGDFLKGMGQTWLQNTATSLGNVGKVLFPFRENVAGAAEGLPNQPFNNPVGGLAGAGRFAQQQITQQAQNLWNAVPQNIKQFFTPQELSNVEGQLAQKATGLVGNPFQSLNIVGDVIKNLTGVAQQRYNDFVLAQQQQAQQANQPISVPQAQATGTGYQPSMPTPLNISRPSTQLTTPQSAGIGSLSSLANSPQVRQALTPSYQPPSLLGISRVLAPVQQLAQKIPFIGRFF